mmetsp:Transcript_26177/g.26417  ORF Transcript_26177/g.26417 Transcript_26177/m.26417 type:complete len:185 (+) Transcript_26177:121-675(+)
MSDVTGDRERRKEKVMSLALGEGLKWGLISTSAGLGGTLYGMKYSPLFVKSFSTSARTSIPVMAGVFSFSLAYELTMNSAHRYPERWGLEEGSLTKKAADRIPTNMPFHHTAANTLYDYSFEFVGVAGLGLASKILYDQMKITQLTISQRIMHSRVFAQAGVLSILLPTMAFREFMDKRGRYFE